MSYIQIGISDQKHLLLFPVSDAIKQFHKHCKVYVRARDVEKETL